MHYRILIILLLASLGAPFDLFAIDSLQTATPQIQFDLQPFRNSSDKTICLC